MEEVTEIYKEFIKGEYRYFEFSTIEDLEKNVRNAHRLSQRVKKQGMGIISDINIREFDFEKIFNFNLCRYNICNFNVYDIIGNTIPARFIYFGKTLLTKRIIEDRRDELADILRSEEKEKFGLRFPLAEKLEFLDVVAYYREDEDNDDDNFQGNFNPTPEGRTIEIQR